jgi:hypothetical protein
MARNMKCPETGKDIHFTADAADRAAAHRGKRAGVPLYKYKCLSCRQWHLTHKPAKASQRVSA